ncbi:hypothetical protein JTB14_034313 [Gonioctena quinquepunctata]|nr:hypothetical protein JTB14_034313 [Gonioctena quinquepunctata]
MHGQPSGDQGPHVVQSSLLAECIDDLHRLSIANKKIDDEVEIFVKNKKEDVTSDEIEQEIFDEGETEDIISGEMHTYNEGEQRDENSNSKKNKKIKNCKEGDTIKLRRSERNNKACKEIKIIEETAEKLKTNFKITCLGHIDNYLGIQVKKDIHGIYSINQKKYIMKLLRNFKMENSKAVTIPLDTGYYRNRNSNDDRFRNEDIYRSAIGALLYLSVNTRPDICVATSILGRNVSDPYTYDWSEVKRIMKYLNGTIDMEIKLGKISSDIDEDILYGYAVADWAGDRSDRKSNSGYLFKFMGAMFDWRCKKQTCVALSSTEAEFISLSEASQQAIYLKGLLQDFQQDVTTTVMFEDNQSCLKLLDNEKMSDRTKHIETKYNFVKNLKLTNKIMFQYCPSHSMLADFLTKPLGPEKLRNNIEMVEVYQIPDLLALENQIIEEPKSISAPSTPTPETHPESRQQLKITKPSITSNQQRPSSTRLQEKKTRKLQ